jgi:hypothetical protein
VGNLVLQRFDGGLGRRELRILRADPEIHVADEFIARISGVPELTFGDGILTVCASNGTVSYGLCEYDTPCMWWRGVRAGDWP